MAHSRVGGDPNTLSERIAAISELDRAGLEERWRRIYRRDPPPRTSRELMVRAVAYNMQVEAHGGLDRRTRRRLEQLVANPRSSESMGGASPPIKPGTRLVRGRNGETYDVLVLEEGFAFRGRVHRSLSAIAREITGTNWNGHVFFGLKRRSVRTDAGSEYEPHRGRPLEQVDG